MRARVSLTLCTTAIDLSGRYYLVCLPLKFPELDGAPARAVLLEW
jgi:kynurenine formamidase